MFVERQFRSHSSSIPPTSQQNRHYPPTLCPISLLAYPRTAANTVLGNGGDNNDDYNSGSHRLGRAIRTRRVAVCLSGIRPFRAKKHAYK